MMKNGGYQLELEARQTRRLKSIKILAFPYLTATLEVVR